MAREITTAWVYVPSMHITSKKLSFDEVRSFCKEHILGIWDNRKSTVIPASAYELKPERVYCRTYGFISNSSYLTAPSVTLVPFGTTLDYGRFVFPKSVSYEETRCCSNL